jgi:methylated-DNA-protein-cysteine methyltransferase-like protein
LLRNGSLWSDRDELQCKASARWGRLKAESRYERIYAVIRRIPPGRVSTYGQVAALAGLPGHARQVGYALYALSAHSTVPWHRVVNAQGRLSLGAAIPEGDVEQRIRLEIEGVEFDADGRIPLGRYQWRPRRMAKLP